MLYPFYVHTLFSRSLDLEVEGITLLSCIVDFDFSTLYLMYTIKFYVHFTVFVVDHLQPCVR